MIKQKDSWTIVYDTAVREDGSLFFPEKLNKEYLENKRKELGPYIFANQMLNRIIPEGEQDFKKEWLVYYDELPKRKNTYAFVDPAISLEEDADYTAVVVVDVDANNDWYLRAAKRYRVTATQTVQLIFQIAERFNTRTIGIEVVAYQKALMHFLEDEMRRRNQWIHIWDYNPGPNKTKEDRIRGLIPRFEWGSIKLARGLHDFEDEYSKFPRGANDDLLDALASIQAFAYPPSEDKKQEKPPAPNAPDYESWYIKQIKAGKKP